MQFLITKPCTLFVVNLQTKSVDMRFLNICLFVNFFVCLSANSQQSPHIPLSKSRTDSGKVFFPLAKYETSFLPTSLPANNTVKTIPASYYTNSLSFFCKKELQQFFSNLTGYITIILFLLVNGLFLFVLKDSNLFDFGYATLDKLFELAPWIFIFLVPAITMRSLSEEFRAGTFEILQTIPLTRWQVVLGKYFSSLLILVFLITPTFLYLLTIKGLSATGNIDGGGITGSYIGLFFLGAVFAAVGLCCSSFTNNTVTAFLISAFDFSGGSFRL